MTAARSSSCIALVAALVGFLFSAARAAEEVEADPPEVAIGERLFLEARFSQFFHERAKGYVNAVMAAGDPVLARTLPFDGELAGSFAAGGMNCRACHLVDEHKETHGNRSYADFARRSPVSERGDGRKFAPRNSPPLVNALYRHEQNRFLHADGEFFTARSLVIGTMTGRNFGWLPQEEKVAREHIVKVVREDDGNGALAKEFGGAYRVVLKGTDPAIPEEFRLPKKFRIDVEKASADEVREAIAALVEAYMESLAFALDENGEFNGSPYDVFLKKNRLPRKPKSREGALEYGRRLRGLLAKLERPKFVSEADGKFATHKQEFSFGEEELRGLQTFLSEPGATTSKAGVGNCIACHAPPLFTDFNFHNTGAAQEEYDALHGEGAFAALDIPDLEGRGGNVEKHLPPTAAHPNALGTFLSVPSREHPGQVDLGLWNVFANDDFANPQKALNELLSRGSKVTKASELLPRTIALFKTPSLRDPGHSAPYLHTGQKDTLEDVVDFYRSSSQLMREGKLRNGARELEGMSLTPEAEADLTAFLRALNEDYE